MVVVGYYTLGRLATQQSINGYTTLAAHDVVRGHMTHIVVRLWIALNSDVGYLPHVGYEEMAYLKPFRWTKLVQEPTNLYGYYQELF
jgi:hypothetical protein